MRTVKEIMEDVVGAIVVILIVSMAASLLLKPSTPEKPARQQTRSKKAANYGSVVCQYVDNYDGDTLRVNIPEYPPIFGRKMPVRVNGIDTLEIKDGQPDAFKAKEIVRQLCSSARVLELRNIKREQKYGRILADVYADGINVADVLLKNGLAVPYSGGNKAEAWGLGTNYRR